MRRIEKKKKVFGGGGRGGAYLLSLKLLSNPPELLLTSCSECAQTASSCSSCVWGVGPGVETEEERGGVGTEVGGEGVCSEIVGGEDSGVKGVIIVEVEMSELVLETTYPARLNSAM